MRVKTTRTSSKVLTMPHTPVICRRGPPKSRKVTLTESSRGYSILIASNKTPSIKPYGPGSKIKSLPEETCHDKLPERSGYFFFVSIAHWWIFEN